MKLLYKSSVMEIEADYKSVEGQVSVSDEGIVEAFVAAMGNKDSVGDIIIPGAFAKSLGRRKPRVVWGHDWNHPIGKVLEIYEVGPNDPRLPMKMKMANVGGLFARVQFNLKSEKGREAFENIKFFGTDQEWSIGYKTLDAEFDGKKQANILKELELYEVSPVLHGANQLTATVSFKADNLEEHEQIVRGLAMLKTFADENPEFVDEMKSLSDEDVEEKRFFTTRQRHVAAESGAAMSDGSFPIANAEDLRNAIQAVGRAKNSAAAKAHIKRRAAALGLTGSLPDDWKSDEDDIELKAGGEPDVSRGEIAGGRGPRRGNLEDLLKYWRPIMKRGGGFRRCLAELADHPELGSLPRLCAWLHHETTGKWPNEGNHHGKSAALNPATGKGATLAKAFAETFGEKVTLDYATDTMVVFASGDEMFKVAYVMSDDDVFFGKKEAAVEDAHEDDDHDCGGDCDDDCCKPKGKADDADLLEKVGRTLSQANMGKLREALALLQAVVNAGGTDMIIKDGLVFDSNDPDFEAAVQTVNSFHGSDRKGLNDTRFFVAVKSDQHKAALSKVASHFGVNVEEV